MTTTIAKPAAMVMGIVDTECKLRGVRWKSGLRRTDGEHRLAEEGRQQLRQQMGAQPASTNDVVQRLRMVVPLRPPDGAKEERRRCQLG